MQKFRLCCTLVLVLLMTACQGEKKVIVVPTQASTPTPLPTATETLPPLPTQTPLPTETPPLLLATIAPAPEFPTATASLVATEEIELLPTESTITTTSETVERLTINTTESGQITQGGETQRYTFLGMAEQTLSFIANLDPAASGTLDPMIQLQAPDGTILAENEDMMVGVQDALLRNITLPTTGVYTLYVRSADGIGTGGYLLSLSDGFTLRDVERGAALEIQPNSQQLETYAARDVWTIELAAGEVISVAAQGADPASDFDVMVEVVAPDGQSWFDNDSGGGRDAFLNEITAPVSGTYRLHIASKNNATIGDYILWWQRVQ